MRFMFIDSDTKMLKSVMSPDLIGTPHPEPEPRPEAAAPTPEREHLLEPPWMSALKSVDQTTGEGPTRQ